MNTKRYVKKIIEVIQSVGGNVNDIKQNGHLKIYTQFKNVRPVMVVFPVSPSNTCAENPVYILKCVKKAYQHQNLQLAI